MMKNKKNLKVVSLFSGIGGFEHGLENSKITGATVFACEIDKFAQKSYLSNFPNVTMQNDITQVDENIVPNHDLLLAGFPCQSFSIAGNRQGFEDTRGTLFFDIARILKAKTPKYILLENVENLINHDDSNTIKVILKTLSSLNYTLDFTILNSKDFGVPQNRSRTFIIGIRNYKITKFNTDCNSTKINKLKVELNKDKSFRSFNFFNSLIKTHQEKTISDVIDKNVDKKYYLSKPEVYEYINTLEINESKTNVNKIIKLFDLPKNIHNDQERQRRVYSIYGISPTILARSDSTKILIENNQNYNIRKVTPKESLRIQGFHENFINNLISANISDTQLYKQSGNAVSPPVITEILNLLENIISLKTKNKIHNFKFIDLFAGIGGFRLALESLGGQCVFSSEIDKFARNTYYENFGEYPSGDIKSIDIDNIPKHDVLCAGFPCQPFSLAGKRLGFNDTRGTLFFEVAKIIKHKKPKSFILENVSGIVNHDNGNTLQTILNTLDELDYDVEWKLMNAKDFNIPQNRNRWYCIGIHKKLNINPLDIELIFPQKQALEYTLNEIIENNSNSEFIISDIAMANINSHIENYRKKNTEHSNILIANNIRPSKVSFSCSGISPCLTAKMGTGGNNIPVIVNQKRKFTVEECKKIMGFPNDFIMKENYSQSYKQLGNSVVVPIIETLAANLIELINIK